MKTIYLHLSIGFPTATRDDELEIEDDATEEEIEETVRDWANNYIEYSWSNEPRKRYR
jgi:hypothetical protein